MYLIGVNLGECYYNEFQGSYNLGQHFFIYTYLFQFHIDIHTLENIYIYQKEEDLNKSLPVCVKEFISFLMN